MIILAGVFSTAWKHIGAAFSGAWEYLYNQIRYMTVWDILDILIVSVLLYYIFRFIRDRRAGKLAIGVLFLVAIQVISELCGLATMKFLLQNLFQIGLLALIIIFQPELRSILESVGGDSLKSLKNIGEQKEKQEKTKFINELCDAVIEMSRSKTGALIVLENTTKLGDVINSGTIINADTTSLLLRNIFFNKSPLHDGAVIIRNMRVYAAGCLLPLTTANNLTKDLGTRHRAAIGMSQNSDATVIVVSEETGIISLAKKGQLNREHDGVSLKLELEQLYIESASPRIKKRLKNHDDGHEDDTREADNEAKQ